MKEKNILVLLWSTAASGRDFMYGFSSYLKKRPGWNIRLVPTNDGLPPDIARFIRSGAFDGIVANENTLRTNPVLRSRKDTVLVIFGTRPARRSGGSVVYIQNDDRKIGRTGARHFMELGRFRSFGFVQTIAPRQWSQDRADGFAEEASKAQAPIDIFNSGSKRRSLAAWIRNLPKPCAIMAAYDSRAIEVVETAKKAGFDIPRQVAVLGVDNDDLLCNFTFPSISSIQPPHQENGFAAGKALDQWIGNKCGRKTDFVLCAGEKVVQRESTALLTPASHMIQNALEFIHRNAATDLRVGTVISHLKVSRRLADLRFREFQGESILETITRARLEEVARRLVITKLSISAIARSCGFKDVSYLVKLFRRKYGDTPRNWRKSHSP